MGSIVAENRKSLMLFSGQGFPELAEEISQVLGVAPTPSDNYEFANGEIFVRFKDSVRGSDAFVVQSVWAIVLLFTGKYGDLLNTVVFADWIFFGLTVAGLFVLRNKMGKPEGFRTPGYPWLPALFVLVALVVVYSVVREAPLRAAVGAGLLLVGVPVFYLFKRNSANG